MKVSGQTGILVPNGKKVVLTCNGTDIVEAHTAIVGNATMGGTLGVTGATTLSSTLGVTGVTTVAAGSAALPAIVSTTGTADTGLWFPAADTIAASTGGTERIRIDSSGNLLVGATSATAKLTVTGGGSGATAYLKQTTLGSYAGIFDSVINVATYYLVSFLANGTQTGSIVSNGTTTTYATSSDVRLKENIVDAPSALPTLAELQVRSFDWKNGPHHKFGFIAQEVVEVDPNAVAKGPTENDMWGIDNSVLVPMLVKAIQELSAEVEALKAKVGA